MRGAHVNSFLCGNLLTTGVQSGCKALAQWAHWSDQLGSLSHTTSKFHKSLDVKIVQSDTILVRLEVKWVQGWHSDLPSLLWISGTEILSPMQETSRGDCILKCFIRLIAEDWVYFLVSRGSSLHLSHGSGKA